MKRYEYMEVAQDVRIPEVGKLALGRNFVLVQRHVLADLASEGWEIVSRERVVRQEIHSNLPPSWWSYLLRRELADG